MTKEKAWDWIDENRKHIVELSDRIWEYAELGLVEDKSNKLLADELERQGFEVERGVAGMPTASSRSGATARAQPSASWESTTHSPASVTKRCPGRSHLN